MTLDRENYMSNPSGLTVAVIVDPSITSVTIVSPATELSLVDVDWVVVVFCHCLRRRAGLGTASCAGAKREPVENTRGN